mmetsp:Transcript_29994/g.46442  ORF Transcript_29994/g.46442 Transcript_29994/m.46442 type:complete len:287 (-) Transcript_29994:310-1170(-)
MTAPKSDDIEKAIFRKRPHKQLHHLTSMTNSRSPHRPTPINNKNQLSRRISKLEMRKQGHHRSQVATFVDLKTHTRFMGLRNLNVHDKIVGHHLGPQGEANRSGLSVDLVSDGVRRRGDGGYLGHHMARHIDAHFVSFSSSRHGFKVSVRFTFSPIMRRSISRSNSRRKKKPLLQIRHLTLHLSHIGNLNLHLLSRKQVPNLNFEDICLFFFKEKGAISLRHCTIVFSLCLFFLFCFPDDRSSPNLGFETTHCCSLIKRKHVRSFDRNTFVIYILLGDVHLCHLID